MACMRMVTAMLFWLLFLLLGSHSGETATVTWKADDITLKSTDITFIGPWYIYITLQSSNQTIYTGDGGHFRYSFLAETALSGSYYGLSSCISLAASDTEIVQAISGTSLVSTNDTSYAISLSDLFDVSVETGSVYRSGTQIITHNLTLDSPETLYLSGNFSTDGCATARSVGLWSSNERWVDGAVPTESDSVVIPEGSGVILMEDDISVSSLYIFGGLLLGYSTSCPSGWTPYVVGNLGAKCFRMETNGKAFDSAQTDCISLGSGSPDAHLVQISSHNELNAVKRICRKAGGNGGCWIGLKDKLGTGSFTWVQGGGSGGIVRNTASALGSFRDWKRTEPNNHTVSEGVVSSQGERCTLLTPWFTDPLHQEQGSWNDQDCALPKSYICQVGYITTLYSLMVDGVAQFHGGQFGGGNLILNGLTNITVFNATLGARVKLNSSSSSTIAGTFILEGGAYLDIEGYVEVKSGSFIGESDSIKQAQPLLSLSEGVTMLITNDSSSSSSNIVSIDAAVDIEGAVVVDGCVLQLEQGGNLSMATFDLSSATSSVSLGPGNYGSRLSTYDAVDIVIKSRAQVVGEYDSNSPLETSSSSLDTSSSTGVYRLQARLSSAKSKNLLDGSIDLTSTTNSTVSGTGYDISRCIPYHATAEDIASVLGAMPLVAARGTTVRRYGDGTDGTYSFGYTHRIEMDAPTTNLYEEGALEISVLCYGSNDGCGCHQTKVIIPPDVTDVKCERSADGGSLPTSLLCTLSPTISSLTISELSQTQTTGLGFLVVTDGVHRLPPKSNVTIAVTGGLGIVGANEIIWPGLVAIDNGSLVVTGSGWGGWDSAVSVLAPEWTTYRGMIQNLDNVPNFNLRVESFYLNNRGSVLATSPRSNMTWVSGSWDGGTIGGRFTLTISSVLNAGVDLKALRYAATLVIPQSAVFNWTGGNISLLEGANIFIDGFFNVANNRNTSGKVVIGQGQLLSGLLQYGYDGLSEASFTTSKTDSSGIELSQVDLLTSQSGRQWHGYYDNNLPAQLRRGWYNNPLCADKCLLQSNFTVRGNGSITTMSSAADAMFVSPVYLVKNSTLLIVEGARIELASGGLCGPTTTIYAIGELDLSGGQTAMRSSCSIVGRGKLHVTGGRHDIPKDVYANLLLSGGSLVWPTSRGNGQQVTVHGTLTMELAGELHVEPFSTVFLVSDPVVLSGDCLIQFPMIGTSAQPSIDDLVEAPDPSPRGNFTAASGMRYLGGTLRGKADFNAIGVLYLDGSEKRIRSLAKLVSKAHTEWGSGDIITGDNGAFLNLGTVQMAEGVQNFDSSFMYEGAVLPIENGGDPYAKLFHTWDTDQGNLDYTEYIKLRTEFVSRTPAGWTSDSQNN